MGSEKSGGSQCRGQVGVETLIVFIAMILVAAIAASLLISTATKLQTDTSQTGEESNDQLTNRLQVVSAWANVTDAGTVDNVTLWVRIAPGSGAVNLDEVTTIKVGDNVSGRVATMAPDDDETVLVDPADNGYIYLWKDGLPEGYRLHGGDRFTVKITTSSGATTVYEVRIPHGLESEEIVEV